APVFSRVDMPSFNGQQGVTDLVFEPGSSSVLLVASNDFFGLGLSGIYRTANAATASQSPSVAPTFVRTFAPASPVNTKLAINRHKVSTTVTVLAATAENAGIASGALRTSTDGGQSFSAPLAPANGFCGGQCGYDIAVAIDPTNAQLIYLGGAAEGTNSRLFTKSINGGTSFTSSSVGLHADMHAIALAPSRPSTI